MRAALFLDQEAPLSVEDVDQAPPGPGDVVVKVMATGICHSDQNAMRGLTPISPPCILGHEATGIVEHVGDAVTTLAVGDRVIGTFIPSCGRCPACARGRPNLCRAAAAATTVDRAVRHDGSGVSAMGGLGSFAEAMVCGELSLVKVQSDVPDEQLALLGCAVTTGVGAVLNTACVEPGSTVVVFGCGGVGQAVVQGARVAGAAQIVAVDPVLSKREIALKLGATDACDSGADVVGFVEELTRGWGADYAFEATGRPDVLGRAFDCLSLGGAAVAVGLSGSQAMLEISSHALVTRERKILGSYYGSANVRREFPRLLALMETGRLDVGALVSGTIGLDEINVGFESLSNGSSVRTVILFD